MSSNLRNIQIWRDFCHQIIKWWLDNPLISILETQSYITNLHATVDGSEILLTSWVWYFIPVLTGFYTSQAVSRISSINSITNLPTTPKTNMPPFFSTPIYPPMGYYMAYKWGLLYNYLPTGMILQAPSIFFNPRNSKLHYQPPCYCWWFRNPANQLSLVLYPSNYRVLHIPGGITNSITNSITNLPTTPPKTCHFFHPPPIFSILETQSFGKDSKYHKLQVVSLHHSTSSRRTPGRWMDGWVVESYTKQPGGCCGCCCCCCSLSLF